MIRFFILFSFMFVLWSCSTPKNKFVYDDARHAVEGVETADNSKPATFDEYRQWRKINDPSGQTYADYKKWAAAYKQWIKYQTKVPK